jgi:hypothetical protein
VRPLHDIKVWGGQFNRDFGQFYRYSDPHQKIMSYSVIKKIT